MKYETVFWDIDGGTYDNSKKIPDDEKEILSEMEKSGKVPDRKLNFWVPYDGLVELMQKIPKERQGIISNGVHQSQINKLILLGLIDYFNPALIFTSYGEAEKILDTPDHPLLEGFYHQFRSTDVDNLTLKTQKPKTYMFERAVEASGCSPENCVMIGDDWKDVFGAQKVGMKTIYIHGLNKEGFSDPIAEGRINPDYIIQKGDIKALRDLLI